MNWKRLRTPALIATAIAGTAAISGAVGASAAVHYLVLGAKNATTTATYVNNSRGTPLALNSKAGTAPLAVGSSTLVSRLNSDYVDGYHASSFAKVTGKTGTIIATNTYAECPKGTVLTGGGGFATGGGLIYSGPFPTDINDDGSVTGFVPNTWWAISGDASTYYSYATCYSPSGAAIPGAGKMPAAAVKGLSPKLQSQAKARAASATSAKPSASPTPVASGTTSPSPAAPSPSPSAGG